MSVKMHYNFFRNDIVLSDEVRLMTYLKQRHDIFGKFARPTYNSSQAVQVQFSLDLFQILQLDEKSQTLTTKTWKGYVRIFTF